MDKRCLRLCADVLALVAALAMPALSARGIEVGGTLSTNTVWAANDSPVIVTSNVSMGANLTLTIEEGVQIQMYAGTRITVRGTLQALGAAGHPVVFTNFPAHAHGGQVRVEGVSYSRMATGILQHCTFRMSDPADPAVYGSYCVITMSDCDVLTEGEGIQFWHSQVRLVRNSVVVLSPKDPVDLSWVTGLFGTNYVSFPNGDLNAVDVNYTYDGPGDQWMIIENNTVRGGLGSNSDCIDLGSARAIVRANHLLRCGDKGVSFGERTIAYVYDNLIEQCGMGLGVKDSSQAICANNTIVDCTYGLKAYQKNAGMGGGKTSMTNCIIWGCGQSVLLLNGSILAATDCDIALDGTNTWPGTGNLNADPQFEEPLSQNFRLLPGSPCINTGTHLSWMDGALDLDGAPRIAEGVVDLGCYELNPGQLNCNFVADPRRGPPPLTAVFTAHLTGTNTAAVYYRWDFGGAGAVEHAGWGLSTITNVYTNAGRYSVALAVSNAVGETARTLKADYIRVLGPPFVYVSPRGDPQYPYTNWATAAREIQTAVDVGMEGTTVLITNGVYDLSAAVTVRQDVVVQSVNGPRETTVNGGDVTRCFVLEHPDAAVDGLTIAGGRANRGGGVYCDGNGAVRNCIIRNNSATADGGGVLLARGGVLRNCLIVSNSAAMKGGGVSIEKEGWVKNCTVTANSAPSGGGVRTLDGGTILNSILYYNTSGGNYANDGSLYYFSYSYSCVTPLVAGAGNTTASPLFADRAAGDYRLSAGSPGRDAGQNEVWMGSDHDIDGHPRIINDIVDLGAYEYGALTCDFVGEPRVGAPPLCVTFTASAGGLSTQELAYAWDFDANGSVDAAGSGLRSVSHTYSNAGLYAVSLAVANAVGDAASVAKQNYIMAQSAVLYVSPSGKHLAPYASWEQAATNIETAVSNAVDTTTILVTNALAPYRPPAQIALQRGITLRAVGRPGAAIIDGRGAHRVLMLQHANATVDGFTITGGKADNGGGIYISGGTVQNCTISNNTATVNGGGVYVDLSGLVQDCRMLNNSAGAPYGSNAGGGGVCLSQGGTIRRCLVAGNTATANDGAGLYLYKGGLAQNCLVVSNVAADATGGVYLYQGGTVEHCTVVQNRGARHCGTRCNGGGTLRNCVIWSNYQPNLSLVNYGDTAPFTYTFCDTTPLHTGVSNIDANPLFANPSSADYRLQAGSPCIDKGTVVGSPQADLDGVPRPLDGNGDGRAACDIGAYEFASATADTDHDRMSDANEVSAGTDPTNANSFLGITGVSNLPGPAAGFVIQWSSVAGKWYRLDRSTNLLSAPLFNVNVRTNVPGTPPLNTATDTTTVGGGPCFYRVGLLP